MIWKKQPIANQLATLNSKISNIVSIGNNADLNNYLTPGKYGCTSNASAATIVNSPISVAFYLDVYKLQNAESGAWVTLLQQVTRYDGSVICFRRCYTDGSGTWLFSEWAKYESARDVKITSVGRYSGDSIAAGATSLYTITFSGSDIPTGYKPIGLVSFTTNTGVFFAAPTAISATAMTVRLYNASGTATNPGNMTFGIMHVLA